MADLIYTAGGSSPDVTVDGPVGQPGDTSVCPKCGGPLRDLRNAGFNAKSARREGVCFLFNSNVFECVLIPDPCAGK